MPYSCHGLTFGGTKAKNGPFSPFSGPPVNTILKDTWKDVPEKKVEKRDILILKDKNGFPIHSATFTQVSFYNDGTLNLTKTLLDTKNGANAQGPPESLKSVLNQYKPDTATVEYYTKN